MTKRSERVKFGKYLHKIRMDMHMTLREFCKKYGLDPEVVSKVEAGAYDLWDSEKMINEFPPAFINLSSKDNGE